MKQYQTQNPGDGLLYDLPFTCADPAHQTGTQIEPAGHGQHKGRDFKDPVRHDGGQLQQDRPAAVDVVRANETEDHGVGPQYDSRQKEIGNKTV